MSKTDVESLKWGDKLESTIEFQRSFGGESIAIFLSRTPEGSIAIVREGLRTVEHYHHKFWNKVDE